jgi:hypothetical protein
MLARCLSLPLAAALLAASLPARAQTGLTPLSDLGAGTYLGFPGGLYPGGSNAPPAAHLSDALAKASEIVPRDAAGNPDPNGWIAMIAVGMSNTTHEFGAFERNADTDSTRNARVVLLDTGFGGQTATVIANPSAGYWTTMMQRLGAMGLTAAQVQVAWLKEAESHPANDFPVHAQNLRDTLKVVVRNLHTKFPNLKICYVSSRIYGGYSAQGTLNPEPQAYESGFSVKWMIEDQIDGDPGLNHGQLPGDVRAPLLLWGPYLWADGPTPRSDGLTWQLSDLENDHVHPSPAGEQKVAGLLADFFGADATAASWWPAAPDVRLVTVDARHDATVSAAAPGTNFGADPVLRAGGGATPLDTHLRFDLAPVARAILLAKLSLRVDQNGGGAVRRVDDTSWDESTITYASAPVLGPALVSMPQSSRDGTLGANVTAVARADPDRQVAFALVSPAMNPATYHSKEAGQPPRLVLVVSTAPASADDAREPAVARFALGPNPTRHGARVTFELSSAGAVELSVYAVDGRRVRTLAAGRHAAGRHEVVWDGRDARGRLASAGIYVVRLAAAGRSQALRLVRLP